MNVYRFVHDTEHRAQLVPCVKLHAATMKRSGMTNVAYYVPLHIAEAIRAEATKQARSGFVGVAAEASQQK